MPKAIKKSSNNPCPSEFWAKGVDSGRFYYIREGTGDNLSEEDVDAGYVDYIYYDAFETLNDIHEDNISDGGMILIKKLYQNSSVAEIVEQFEDFEEEINILEFD